GLQQVRMPQPFDQIQGFQFAPGFFIADGPEDDFDRHLDAARRLGPPDFAEGAVPNPLDQLVVFENHETLASDGSVVRPLAIAENELPENHDPNSGMVSRSAKRGQGIEDAGQLAGLAAAIEGPSIPGRERRRLPLPVPFDLAGQASGDPFDVAGNEPM